MQLWRTISEHCISSFTGDKICHLIVTASVTDDDLCQVVGPATVSNGWWHMLASVDGLCVSMDEGLCQLRITNCLCQLGMTAPIGYRGRTLWTDYRWRPLLATDDDDCHKEMAIFFASFVLATTTANNNEFWQLLTSYANYRWRRSLLREMSSASYGWQLTRRSSLFHVWQLLSGNDEHTDTEVCNVLKTFCSCATSITFCSARRAFLQCVNANNNETYVT
jgi:hypothetical protein